MQSSSISPFDLGPNRCSIAIYLLAVVLMIRLPIVVGQDAQRAQKVGERVGLSEQEVGRVVVGELFGHLDKDRTCVFRTAGNANHDFIVEDGDWYYTIRQA